MKGMADGVVRFLELAAAPRFAANVLVAGLQLAAVVGLGGEAIPEHAERAGMPILLFWILVIALAYAVGSLTVEGFVKTVRWYHSLVQQRVQTAEQRKAADLERERSRRRIEHVLPHMSRESHSILTQLLRKPSARLPTYGGVDYLEEQQVVERVAESTDHHAIYRVIPGHEELIRQFFKDERKQAIRSALESLGPDETAFLQLFADANATIGTRRADEMMPAAMYQGGESLERRGILIRKKEEAEGESREFWNLRSDVKPFFQNMIGDVARDEVMVDISCVAPTGNRGSGSRSRW
jgi:hypothetical protein